MVSLARQGELSEWFKELVLKTSDGATHREFESHTLRQETTPSIKDGVVSLPEFKWEIRMTKCNSPGDCCSRRLDGAKPLFSAKAENAMNLTLSALITLLLYAIISKNQEVGYDAKGNFL